MKCKFYKKCKNYNEDSRVCNVTAGMYYEDGTEPAGCYRENGENEHKTIT